ncbi:hypothetical protein Bca101_098061 [Brassica carinata]
MQVGSTSADVHTGMKLMAIYASNGFGMREVDGSACEVQNKVETVKMLCVREGEDADDEDYDYNLWHDFVGRNCEWGDDKDEDGGVHANPPSTFEDYVDEGRDYIGSSRISMENIEEESNNLGVKSSDQWLTPRIIQIKSRRGPKFGQQLPNVGSPDSSKPFNMHTREVGDNDDFVGQVLNVFRLNRHMIHRWRRRG